MVLKKSTFFNKVTNELGVTEIKELVSIEVAKYNFCTVALQNFPQLRNKITAFNKWSMRRSINCCNKNRITRLGSNFIKNITWMAGLADPLICTLTKKRI